MTFTSEPPRNADASSVTVAGNVDSRSRSRKMLPPRATSVPSTGQPAISRFASARMGRTAPIATMSSHEMWLFTTRAPRPLPSSGSPRTTSRTPNARSTPRNTRRANGSRDRGTNSTGSAANASSTTVIAAAKRSARRGRPTTGAPGVRHPAPHGETGIQGWLMPGSRGRT